MADPKHGEFGAGRPARPVGPDIPTEQWIQRPVSDSSDYLDREPPVYLEDEEPTTEDQ